METFVPNSDGKNNTEFKSYYVVWKRDDIKKDFAPGDVV